MRSIPAPRVFLAFASLIASLALTGCVSEPWVRGLDEAPENAYDPLSDHLPTGGLGAGPASAKDSDMSPAYLGAAHAAENEREIQEITARPTVSLGDAIRLSELNSKDLVAAYEAIVAAHGNVIAAGVYPNPSFAFTSGAMSSHGLKELADGGPSHAIPLMPQAAYTFTQPIVTGLRLVWAKREAVANEWAARATWQVLHRGNVQAVEVAYVNIVFAKENLALQEDLLRYAKELDSIAERQIQAGVLTATDRAQAEVNLAQQRAATDVARQAVVGAEATLAGLTGGITIPAAKITAKFADGGALGGVDRLEESMVQGHPVIRAAELAVSAARADTHLQRAVLWPDVGLSLGYERDYLDSPPNRTFDTINFGLSFTLPLWDRNQGQIVTSDANLLAAEASRTFTVDGLRANLRSSYSSLVAQKQQADGLRKTVVPLAEKTLALATKSFEAGSSRIIDVLNARQNVSSARSTLLMALQARDQSAAGIENMTGERLLTMD